MLVDILLSHRTRDEQTAAAWANLLKTFGSWEGVRDAPTQQVQDTIANVNFPEIKAPRIQPGSNKFRQLADIWPIVGCIKIDGANLLPN